MVLTQREHRVGETLMPTRFHTTMVLTQPDAKLLKLIVKDCFHTTMVHTRAVLRWPSKSMDPSFVKSSSSFRRFASRFFVLGPRYRNAELLLAFIVDSSIHSLWEYILLSTMDFQKTRSWLGTCQDDEVSWFLQPNILLLEGFSLLAKPALRPRMLFRALRPPMIFGASLPGMIFPAERPAEGSNSYHYGSHATQHGTQPSKQIPSFHTTMVLTQLKRKECEKMVETKVSIPLWFSRNEFWLVSVLQKGL